MSQKLISSMMTFVSILMMGIWEVAEFTIDKNLHENYRWAVN
jgi:hypothetical protein